VRKPRIILDYLLDIREQVEAIREFLVGFESVDDFRKDRKTVYAVTRALEVIGEATKNVSPAFRHRHPDLPWRHMAGMRDKVVHEYYGIDIDVLWTTATEDIPRLKDAILGLVEEQERDSGL
jgi:uncharacterized protein with HEPN domain